MRIINKMTEKKRVRPKLTAEQKTKIKERLASKLAKKEAVKEDVKLSREELLKKENVIEISKEVKIELADLDLILEAGDIVEIVPVKK